MRRAQQVVGEYLPRVEGFEPSVVRRLADFLLSRYRTDDPGELGSVVDRVCLMRAGEVE